MSLLAFDFFRYRGDDMSKVALITGVTGQDGSYLAEFLLEKGFEVHGLRRRASAPNTQRIEHLIRDGVENNFHLHYGDMTDTVALGRIVDNVSPDIIYNLAAQSHVHVSFDSPEYTANADALGTMRLLEIIKLNQKNKEIKFYQASTSELFGLIQSPIQNEKTPFYPRSPYAVAKLYSYWISINYREAYDIYASNGILFNHESPRRGDTFVTRKITLGLSNIFLNRQKKLSMGNINAERDWGHARDFIRAQYLIMQQEKPDDYVIATGYKYSVRMFIEKCCDLCGVQIQWIGSGVDEIGIVDSVDVSKFSGVMGVTCQLRVGQTLVDIDPHFFRPTEVDKLHGDPSKAFRELNWKPEISFDELVSEMMLSDAGILTRSFSN